MNNDPVRNKLKFIILIQYKIPATFIAPVLKRLFTIIIVVMLWQIFGFTYENIANQNLKLTGDVY
jgi:hypothetical protein